MNETLSRPELLSIPRAVQRVLALCGLLLVLAFAFQGSRPLYDSDEGRYTTIALNMLDSGDYVVPRLDADHPHYAKPPMTYWALAGSFALFGANEWAARVPSALAFVGTGLLVAWMARRLAYRNPLRAGWIWALMLGPLFAANVVNTDTLLTCFETLAAAGFVAAETTPDGRAALHWRVLMWCGFGLAFLTKGPPGLIALPALAATLASLHGWRAMRRLVSLPGMALGALIGLGWYVCVISRQPGLLHYFLGYEVFDRVATSTHGRNPGFTGLFVAYLPMLLFGTLPWSGMLLFRRLRGIPSPGMHDPRLTLARRLTACWCLIGFSIFAFAQSRLPMYVLPLFVPFALWVALRFDHAAQLLTERRGLALAAWATAMLGVKALGAIFPSHHDGRAFAAQLRKITQDVPVSHWIFVDSTPRFDLRLTTGQKAEIATFANSELPFARREPLCEEISEAPHPVVLTDKTLAARTESALSKCGRFVYRGIAESYAVYVAQR